MDLTPVPPGTPNAQQGWKTAAMVHLQKMEARSGQYSNDPLVLLIRVGACVDILIHAIFN